MSNLDWQVAAKEMKQLAEHLRKQGYRQAISIFFFFFF